MAEQIPSEPRPPSPGASGPSNAADSAKAAAGAAVDTLKTEAASFADTAKGQVRETLQEKKGIASDALSDFANAIRRASEELSQSDRSAASGMVRQAADGLEGLSRSVSEKQPEEMLHALRNFGRENPTAMIAGSVLAGLALGRFLRASDKPRGDEGAGTSSSDGGARAGLTSGHDGGSGFNGGDPQRTAGSEAFAVSASPQEEPIALMDPGSRFADGRDPEPNSDAAGQVDEEG